MEILQYHTQKEQDQGSKYQLDKNNYHFESAQETCMWQSQQK